MGGVTPHITPLTFPAIHGESRSTIIPNGSSFHQGTPGSAKQVEDEPSPAFPLLPWLGLVSVEVGLLAGPGLGRKGGGGLYSRESD